MWKRHCLTNNKRCMVVGSTCVQRPWGARKGGRVKGGCVVEERKEEIVYSVWSEMRGRDELEIGKGREERKGWRKGGGGWRGTEAWVEGRKGGGRGGGGGGGGGE